MSLVFDATVDKNRISSNYGETLGGFDINGNALKVGDRIKFRFDGGNCEGAIYYDRAKFRYVVVSTTYEHVYDFSGLEDIEKIGTILNSDFVQREKEKGRYW